MGNPTIDQWIEGYKVHGEDWIDGNNYYLNIQYIRPGGAISRPDRDVSVLIPKTDTDLLFDRLHSVVTAIMTNPKFDGLDKMPVIHLVNNGKE